MENIDFAAAAEVFISRGKFGSPVTMRYLRFASGAEAIRYVVEKQAVDLLPRTVVQCGDIRFTGSEIHDLYHRDDYPLPRQALN